MRGEKLSFHYAPAMIAFVSLVLYGAAAVVNYFTDPERFWDAVVYSLYSLGFMVLYAAAGVIHDLRPEYGVYAAGVAAVLSVYAIYPGLVAMCWGGLISLAVWLLYFVRLAVENPGLYGRSRLWGVPRVLPALASAPGVAGLAWSMVKTVYDERRPPDAGPAVAAVAVAVLPLMALCYADRPGPRAVRLAAAFAAALAYAALSLEIPLGGYRATGLGGLIASTISLLKEVRGGMTKRGRPSRRARGAHLSFRGGSVPEAGTDLSSGYFEGLSSLFLFYLLLLGELLGLQYGEEPLDV